MKYWSINNHGNELMAYYENDCKESFVEATYILDGHSYDSRNIYHLKKSNRKIESFGPAKNSTYFKNSCLKMGSNVLPTVELSEEKEESESRMKDRSIGSPTPTSQIAVLLQQQTEEINDLNDKTRNLQQKLDHFKMNLDLIVKKHKQDLQEFAKKVKEDLQDKYGIEYTDASVFLKHNFAAHFVSVQILILS